MSERQSEPDRDGDGEREREGDRRPPGKDELAPVPDEERFRRLEKLGEELPVQPVNEEEG